VSVHDFDKVDNDFVRKLSENLGILNRKTVKWVQRSNLKLDTIFDDTGLSKEY